MLLSRGPNPYQICEKLAASKKMIRPFSFIPPKLKDSCRLIPFIFNNNPTFLGSRNEKSRKKGKEKKKEKN